MKKRIIKLIQNLLTFDKTKTKKTKKKKKKIEKEIKYKEIIGISKKKLERKFPWLKKAKFKDAVVGVYKLKLPNKEKIREVIDWVSDHPGLILFKKSEILLWYNGIWEDGIWEEGIWIQGRWKNGVWKDGIWISGIWENGTWKNGYWKGGDWEDGVWENGFFYDGWWYGGVWKDGNMYNCIWEDGTWEKGVWFGGQWNKGKWVKGVMFDNLKQDIVYVKYDEEKEIFVETKEEEMEEELYGENKE